MVKLSEQFERLHQLASERTGLNDFGSSDYQEPLRLLLSDLGSNLSEAGVRSVSDQFVNSLSGRLVANKSFADRPDLLDTPIVKPIFIIGTPRSGTTVLHRLITSDPVIQVLPYWLAHMPVPRPPQEQWGDNPWYQLVEQEYIQKFFKGREKASTLHPIDVQKADECIWVIEQTFWSALFLNINTAPNYTKWALAKDTRQVFEYYRKVLAIISNGDTRQWILKNPAHIFCVDAIMAVFPDARIVHTHRDPVTAVASTSNITWAMSKGSKSGLAKRDIGTSILQTWAHGLKRMEESRRRYDEKQFFDIHMLETQRDPLGTMQRIYEHFDLPVTSQTLTAWRDELERDPNQEHSIGSYDPNDFGINEVNVAEQIGMYAERYRQVCQAKGL